MLLAELETAYASVETLTERVSRFEREVLPQAQHRVDAALAAYRAGRGDLAAAIEAQRGALEIGLQHLALYVELARARALLDYLTAHQG
ncbi:MAG TPA: TolC family protein, partial [Burkholderiales bacterium]|nr:TolC family protein [Burkholderiales bacterium]